MHILGGTAQTPPPRRPAQRVPLRPLAGCWVPGAGAGRRVMGAGAECAPQLAGGGRPLESKGRGQSSAAPSLSLLLLMQVFFFPVV